jgi:hypothetical protein
MAHRAMSRFSFFCALLLATAPQFYANIPGDNSLYVIGLSALGGLYFLGIEGAVFGPLVVSIWLLGVKELRNKIAAAEQQHGSKSRNTSM